MVTLAGVPSAHLLVVAFLVALLAVLHLIQWAAARESPPAGTAEPLSRSLRRLAGGRDPWTRGLLVTAVVALSFAALAPLLPSLAELLGRLVPG